MNLQNFILANRFSNALIWIFLIFLSMESALAGWKIDLSRRKDQMRERELQMRQPASAVPIETGIFESLFDHAEPVQEVVLINSEKGFTPNTLHFKKGHAYKVHVVNVNQELKNVSFVMDSFSQHHATYYGEVKEFYLNPKKEGVFSFICPETSAQGKVVVFPSAASPMQVEMRMPASER